MHIRVFDSERAFDLALAWRIIGQLLEKPDSVIGLVAGNTAANAHAIIAEIALSHPFDLSRATFYGLDELIMAPESYTFSCRSAIASQLRAEALGLCDGQLLLPPVRSDDYARECGDFTRRIEEAGGSDLQILGLGTDGHLGMNLPGSDFDSVTRVVTLSAGLEADLRAKGGWPDDAPIAGITMGLGDIMRMRRPLLAAKGRHKAQIIKSVLEGPVTPELPASVLRLHPAAELFIDKEAAALLTN